MHRFLTNLISKRLLDDDVFGVQQPLNETEFGKGLVARGMHYLIFESSKVSLYLSETNNINEKLL